jgi:bifunctional DNase/RNase
MDSAKQQHEPSELVALTVKQVLDDGNTDTRIVVLKNDDATVTLPIWVGSAEGNAIRLAMERVVTPRPMSHDLIRSFADHLGVRIERVVITDVKGSTYYASVAFASKGVHRTLDARPSDAIALALARTARSMPRKMCSTDARPFTWMPGSINSTLRISNPNRREA